MTKLEFIEGYRFNVVFDIAGVPSLVVDEIRPIGDGVGPNPSRLLSAAVGHCLSSSLLYCLSKSKVRVKKLATEVKANLARNADGYFRIKDLEVQIQLEVNEEDKARVPRCLGIFENYCTVTQSVMKGIDINVKIK